MRTNTAKATLMAGGSAYGIALATGSPAVAEALANSPADFLLLDGQHGVWDGDRMREGLLAASLGTAVPMARVAWNEYHLIARVLDEGAMGIVVPLVENPAEAKLVVDACRFPPVGRRSHGWLGAARHGADYLTTIDDELFVAIQIETAQAAANTEAIMSVPGIDGVWVGPGDLAFSLGLYLPEAKQDPRFLKALEQVVQGCVNAGKVPGYAAFNVADARWASSLGFRYLTCGWDLGYIGDGAAATMAGVRA